MASTMFSHKRYPSYVQEQPRRARRLYVLVKICVGITKIQLQTKPATNGIVEKAVHRVTKGISALPIQFDLAEKWWGEAVESFRYLRIIQDKLAGGKSPYEAGMAPKVMVQEYLEQRFIFIQSPQR